MFQIRQQNVVAAIQPRAGQDRRVPAQSRQPVLRIRSFKPRPIPLGRRQVRLLGERILHRQSHQTSRKIS
jgi:hypothetical protein